MKKVRETRRAVIRPLVILILVGITGSTIVRAAGTDGAGYSWNKPHAQVLPTGDLQWQPEPFVFTPGESVRYIDYENGNDNAAGTRSAPWKHHPWDPAAVGIAAECSGVHTYVFKRGVIYRGSMEARESGRQANPIRLTSDPSWGDGEAIIAGSVRIPQNWKRASSTEAPARMPEPDKVWYIDVAPWKPLHASGNPNRDWIPDALFEIYGDEVNRIHIARDPDYELGDSSYPHSSWHDWDDQVRNAVNIDSSLIGLPADWFEGGSIISQWSGNMGTATSRVVQAGEFDPALGSVRTSGYPVKKGVKYFIEDLPQYLDSPGEYWHDKELDRIYVRLPEDRDPNQSIVEAARVWTTIDIVDKGHVEISGLRFSFNASSGNVVYIRGHSSDIRIANCTFSHIANQGIFAGPRPDSVRCEKYGQCPKPWSLDTMDNIFIVDNEFVNLDKEALYAADGKRAFWGNDYPFGSLHHVEVMRNRMENIGIRQYGSRYSSIPALRVSFARTAEIAGNIIIRSFGTGIMAHGGKGGDKYGTEAPLTRILVHHNKVDHSVLVVNDYGGISLWQGGPIYCYNNISGNSVGHCPERSLSSTWKNVAYPIYLDGAYKIYTFNNITWGKGNSYDDPYRNIGTYFMVFGFLNPVVNNTFHSALKGISGSSGNRSDYLGNIVTHITSSFVSQNRIGDPSLAGGGDTGELGLRGVPTLAYGNNLFHGDAKAGTLAKGLILADNIEEMSRQMQEFPIRYGELGSETETSPLIAPENHDFRPGKTSEAVDNGVGYFVPWSLYATVGEWDFNRNDADPTVAIDYHYYMTAEYVTRHMYEYVPMFNLQLNAADASDYIASESEDWIPGALVFDGARVGTVTDTEMREDVKVNKVQFLDHPQVDQDDIPGEPWRVTDAELIYPGDRRKTLDMDTNNLLVETIVRIDENTNSGDIVGKIQNGTGYRMFIENGGKPGLEIAANGASDQVVSSRALDDGNWHHVLAEVDRTTGISRIFVDGVFDNETEITLGKAASLSNQGDFLVGNGFTGALDFLRICRGTLADALTTIEELYAWQADGPIKRDFVGVAPVGRRDIGAIEYRDPSISVKNPGDTPPTADTDRTFSRGVRIGIEAGSK